MMNSGWILIPYSSFHEAHTVCKTSSQTNNTTFSDPVFYELTFHCLSCRICSSFYGVFVFGGAHRRTLPTPGALRSSDTCCFTPSTSQPPSRCERVKRAEIYNFHGARLSLRGSPRREVPNWKCMCSLSGPYRNGNPKAEEL